MGGIISNEGVNMDKKLMLDLFAGTHSWEIPFLNDKTWNVVSLDIDPLTKSTITEDILKWDYKNDKNMFKTPDLIVASPDCSRYFTKLKNWTGHTKYTEDDYIFSIAQVEVLKNILDYFKPKYWIVENPIGKMQIIYPFINHIHYNKISYCRYGFDYRKDTAIWTNIPLDFLVCNHTTHKIPNLKNLPKELGLNTVKDRQNYRYRIPPLFTQMVYEKVNNLLKGD